MNKSNIALSPILALALTFILGCSEKCGEAKYDPEKQFCAEDKVYEKCSGEEFNPAEKICIDGKITARCGDKGYEPAEQFCYNGDVVEKCGGFEEYNPVKQFCDDDGIVQGLCGGEKFDTAKRFCYDNKIIEKCGGEEYSLKASGSCKKGKFVFNYGKMEDARDGKTYKTIKIGEQVWFAENLNYEAGNCYGRKEAEEEANCKKYGRLYWLIVHIGNNDMPDPVFCPEGWHMPSIEEWKALLDYAGDDAANKLKAKKGWSKHDGTANNGMDIFGFSALPGGYYQAPCCDEDGPTLDGIGEEGTWWAVGGTFGIREGKEVIFQDMKGVENTCSYSIRCIKD